MARQRTNGIEQEIGSDPDDGANDGGDDAEVIYGSGGDAIPVVEPSTIQFEPDSTTERKRRGRAKGSRNANPKARKETASDLSGLLLSLHFMAAAITSIPELQLEQKEADLLAKNVAKINELYGGIVLPEKTMAWINLGLAAGTVYGPRFVAHRMNKEKAAKGKGPTTIDAQPFKVN